MTALAIAATATGAALPPGAESAQPGRNGQLAVYSLQSPTWQPLR